MKSNKLPIYSIRNQKGAATFLILVAVIGIVLFLIISSAFPFKSGVLSSLFSKPASYAADAIVDPTIGTITGLNLVGLDSTIRANWTPSTDSRIAFQVFSVWDGSTFIGSKIVGRTANVADANGLVSNHAYTIRVQGMDTTGKLSNPVETQGSTDLQSPMKDAAFFESFDDSPPGPLDENYFDVRTSLQEGDQDHRELNQVFNNERHFHTLTANGGHDFDLNVRPRVPFDFTNRTGTFSIEVDLPPRQGIHGNWFELNLTKEPISQGHETGDGSGGAFPNSVEFSFRRNDGSTDINRAHIQINNNGVTTGDFTGTLSQLSPANVRMPVVIKVSQNSAEIFVNGVSAVKATGINIPFTKGYWNITHKSYFNARAINQGVPVLASQLTHWDTIQYDGPAGSYNPVVRTYRQPNCGTFIEYTFAEPLNCPKFSGYNNSTLTLNIPDDVSKARTAKLLFNGDAGGVNGTVTVNGTALTASTVYDDSYGLEMQQVNVPVSALRNGANTIAFNYPNPVQRFQQAQLEVIYNIPRVIGNPPFTPTAMIAATTTNYRVMWLSSGSNVSNFTSYIYNTGALQNLTYNASVMSNSSWLKITSPTSGTLNSIPLGGSLVPVSFTVDVSQLPGDQFYPDGEIGVIKVTGGNVPVYITVIVINQNGQPSYTDPSYPLQSTFNKAAVPDYHGANSSPQSSTTPQPSTTPASSGTASAGDINGNGKVDIFDLNILLGNFGKTGPGLPGDLDNNGKVDIFDYNTLLTNFGR